MFKKIIPILPQIIASLFLTGFMVLAWTEPGSTPPGGNVDTPLNTGLIGQIKQGNLQVNALGVQGTGNAFLVPNGKVGIGTQNPQDQLHLEAANAARLRLKETNSWETVLESVWQNTFNIWNQGGVRFTIKDDKVGIGTQTPSEKLDVAGNIKIGSNGQVKNLRAENVSSLPAPGSAGRMVFNTSDNKMYFDNGTSWKAIGTQVALVGPLGVGIVQVPAEAYQVMCIVSEPGTSFNTTCNANRAYYNGANKIDVSTGDQHSGGGHVGAAIWDADGGGLLEGKRYFFSTVCLNFFWVTPSGGWCLQYEGCKEQDASIGSCYYTTLQ